MKRGRWFLPEEPDVVRLILEQLAVTLATLDDFGAWAGGEAAAGDRLRGSAERGDAAKRAVTGALRSAFVLPIEPEDVFTISRGIDWIRRDAADIVAEAEVLACEPDAGLAEVAGVIRQAAGLLDGAIAKLVEDGDAATANAEAAIEAESHLADAYQRGMAALLDVDDRSARIGRRELYRRCARIGDVIVEVAERVMYAVVKRS